MVLTLMLSIEPAMLCVGVAYGPASWRNRWRGVACGVAVLMWRVDANSAVTLVTMLSTDEAVSVARAQSPLQWWPCDNVFKLYNASNNLAWH